MEGCLYVSRLTPRMEGCLCVSRLTPRMEGLGLFLCLQVPTCSQMDGGDVSSSTVKISLPWTWRPFKRHMLPGSELFVDGDRILHSSRKLIPLEDENETGDKDANIV